MRTVLTVFLSLLFVVTWGQPNCKYFKSIGDDCQYQACIIATNSRGYQGSRLSQVTMDRAIEACPGFGYAYKVKSIPYLKRGLWIEWKKLIDNAVKYDPQGQLGYRGWCRFQFLRDYAGALQDFEELSNYQNNLGYSANGTYHLEVAKALSLRGLGRLEEAIDVLEGLLEDDNYMEGRYDYLHLGVFYMMDDQLEKAEKSLQRQLENEITAEVYYYLAKVALGQDDIEKGKEFLSLSRKQYELTNYMSDPYAIMEDRIFMQDIEYLEKEML